MRALLNEYTINGVRRERREMEVWECDRHAAGAGGRAKAGRQATYLLIRLRRKSPCIYFELAGASGVWARPGRGRGARADADAGLAPEGFPSAPRPARLEVTAPVSFLPLAKHSDNLFTKQFRHLK